MRKSDKPVLPSAEPLLDLTVTAPPVNDLAALAQVQEVCLPVNDLSCVSVFPVNDMVAKLAEETAAMTAKW